MARRRPLSWSLGVAGCFAAVPGYTILYYTILYQYYTIVYTIRYDTILYLTLRYDNLLYYKILHCTEYYNLLGFRGFGFGASELFVLKRLWVQGQSGFQCLGVKGLSKLWCCFSRLYGFMDPGVQSLVADPLPEAAIVKGACR